MNRNNLRNAGLLSLGLLLSGCSDNVTRTNYIADLSSDYHISLFMALDENEIAQDFRELAQQKQMVLVKRSTSNPATGMMSSQYNLYTYEEFDHMLDKQRTYDILDSVFDPRE